MSKSMIQIAYCISKLAKIPLAELPTAYMSIFLMTIILFLTHTIELHPTIRYVSPTGNNIPPYLSWEDAANVIQDAINVCEPGDTVLVDNGTYYENLIINTPISLVGLSMDSTVIDGRGLGDVTVRLNETCFMKNLNIYGKGLNTIQTAAITAFKYLSIEFCQISEASGGVGFINSGLIKYCMITNCRAGIGLAPVADTCEILVNNNLITLNNFDESGIRSSIYGVYYIENNTILFTGPISNPANGISIGAPRKAYIENNLISGFRYNIFMDVVLDTTFIVNNVLSYNKAGGVVASIQTDGNNTVVNNTILSNNVQAINGDFLVKSDYNIFWGNGTNLTGVSYGDSDRVVDPMFVKDTLPNSQLDFDYHLQAYSPAIDAGNPDILDIDGSRSDIGLYGGSLGQSYKYKDLPPRPPVILSAVVDSNQILLKWNRNSEADTSHYNVYRDTVINFTIDSTKLISSQTDTFFIQYPPYKNTKYVYKITCVDNQRNESLPSEEILVDLTTGIDEYPITINDYLLYQNYPNPFNPSTKIGYKLKDRGYVKLMVYDITGSLVSVLVNKEQEAGYYEIEFNVGNGLPSVPNNNNRILSSGIYLYRIEIIGEGRIPVYTDMKKMILIK